MKPIYTILTVLALLVVSSCYEDKGNYDYQPYHRVLVEVDNNYGIKQPEEAIEYTITPKVTLSNGSTCPMSRFYGRWTGEPIRAARSLEKQ